MYSKRSSSPTRTLIYCFTVLAVTSYILFPINDNVDSGHTLAQDGPAAEATATFTNATPITIGDAPADAGVNGVPYPSTITVTGMTGLISATAGSVKVTINNYSHTFNSDVIISLVGPGGQAFMIQGRAGEDAGESNVTYTLSDTGAAILPDPNWTAGTYKPTSWTSTSSFPAPGPGTAYANPGPAGSATFSSVYGGTSPNGDWKLYVRDLFTGDTGALAGGWSLELTTTGGAPVPDALGDYDADGTTDYAVIRGGANGPTAQTTWFISHNSTAIPRSQAWGNASDTYIPADYDGDQKDDIAVWRPGIQSSFLIIQSSNNTLKSVEFGSSSDNASVVGDYNADGTDDLAVYRQGATAGAQSFFFVSYGGVLYTQAWGLNGDIPAPGDYDGDNRMDFAVQRAEGANGVFYIRYTAPQADTVTTFGLAADMVVPGNYDGDTKTDLAVITLNGSFFRWIYRPSAGGPDVADDWGIAATDYPVPGDYNGDGKADYAVWRPGATPAALSTFFVMRPVTRNIDTRQWGLGEDIPVNLTFAHF